VIQKTGKAVLLPLLLMLLTLAAYPQWLKRSGQKIVNQEGQEVLLRGMGLGGWMLQEPYMMEMSGIASAQWEIKLKIKDLIGEANTVAFYDAWHAGHCTRKDIDSLAAWGFNSVRLPMHYNLYTLPIEDEPVPGEQTWLDKGFALTDSLIKWCSANHMYVILDLHAAPGGQGKDYAICDGNPTKPSLWDSYANKQKTIALWRKLAERYANEPWVGGYDLINEPNWSFTSGGNQNGCTENSNAALRQLLVDITGTIRQVDQNHMVIIEGNCWGNNYNGVLPPWDNNMALSFHKYWSVNDQGSIQGILNLRTQHNIPIWLGESGENSNAWFTEAIQLAEKNNIGWAWWPLKKIGSVVGPLTITKTSQYQSLLDYWKSGGAKPSESFAYYTLMQMAVNARIENCTYHKDVPDAMFRQIDDSTTLPFKPNHIPGTIAASDYDLGRAGKAYSDTDLATYQVTTGTYTDWNSGYSYRNDGVDIEKTSDLNPASNGYDVGWTKAKEWLQYTVTVDSTAVYQVDLRVAGPAGSVIRLQSDQIDITTGISIPSTGGYQSWTNFTIDNVILYEGVHKLRVLFDQGGVNLGFLNFSLKKKLNEIPLLPVSAETSQDGDSVFITFNKKLVALTVAPFGFTATINGTPAQIEGMIPAGSSGCRTGMHLMKSFSDGDTIRISFSDGTVYATDSTMLGSFTDFPVTNNMPLNIRVPGKIEAEDFSVNQGLKLETTTDVGGGQSVGFTDVGDYLDYRIRVMKTATYNMEIRVACLSNAGIIQVQQLDQNGGIIHYSTIYLPVTGGWQTWRSIVAEVPLTEGVSTLRVKILKTEFNLNWYRLSEKGVGMDELETRALKIFPNPAGDEVTVVITGSQPSNGMMTFRNLKGVVVKQFDVDDTANPVTWNIADLPAGFYLVELETNGMKFHGKLIKQ